MESNIKYDIFNVGTGKNYSLNELIEIINNILGTNIKPKYVPNPIKNYVYHTLADPTKAKEKLGFEAKISLEEGIRRLIG
jgi:UDP-glucose 4-epimerase